MSRLIVLSLLLIALLLGCSSEREKTFQNTAEVIKALDRQNLIDCEEVDEVDRKGFLSNDTVSCLLDTGDEIQNSQSGLDGFVVFNISTYDDIKQMDLFKEKCKKDDVGVINDCNEYLEYAFFHSNVMIAYLSKVENLPEFRPASKDTINTILEDLLD